MERPTKTTLALFLGGVLLLAGFYVTLRELRTTLELQLADRFVQAVDQLGKENLELRLGGIYGLERIANRSEKFYGLSMDILATYVKEHARWRDHPASEAVQPTPKPAADVQAALTVLGRRQRTYRDGESHRLDLRKLDLRRANLDDAHLEGAILSGAHLEDATFNGAHLEEAILRDAHLERASFVGAHLEKAFFGGARMDGALLKEARLEQAYLNGTRLEGANLLGVDLKNVIGLDWEQLKTAKKDNRTRLPDYLRLPAPAPGAR